jgi:homoserine kinase type II
MSVYTTVTPQELSLWLARYDVGTLTGLQGIAAGIENTNYFVTTSHARYVLTLFEKLTAAELPFYLGLMAHLAERGIPSARPVMDRDGSMLGELNGKPAALVSFLPGRDILEPAAEHCAQVGEILGCIHIAAADYPIVMENPRGARWWRAAMPEIAPFLGPAEARLLAEEVRFQAEHRTSELPRGAIHADLFRDNVLFDDDDRISGVIDFYFACTDALLYDVAICVNDWCVDADGRVDEARARILLRAYRSVRAFTAGEVDSWPVMLRAGALRFWVSRLYDLHLPRAGELTHAKDPRNFQRILEQHIAHERDLRLLLQ